MNMHSHITQAVVTLTAGGAAIGAAIYLYFGDRISPGRW